MSSLRWSVGLIFLAFVSGAPSVALASWPLEAPGIVLVGYGQTYDRAGDSATHWGLDIGCVADAPVLAPDGGRITFSGWVPTDDGRIRAVTIETDEGLLVTCSPLETADVVAGQSVEPLDVIGTLAPTGDASTPETHLHVSVRRGSAYLDPTAMVGASPGGESAPQSPANEVPAAEVPDVLPPVAATQVPELLRADIPAPSDSGALSGTPITSVETARMQDPVQESETPLASVIEPVGAPIPGTGATEVGPGPVAAADTALSRQTESPGAVVADEAVVPLGSARPRLAPSGRVALLASAGILVGAIGLWPLWRSAARPGFLNGVRPILDDVAAAVGR